MEIECDSCLEEFVPNAYETRVKGGAWQRFNCPGCGKVYDVAFISTQGLKLRTQVNRARGGDPVKFQELLEAYQAEVSRPADVV